MAVAALGAGLGLAPGGGHGAVAAPAQQRCEASALIGDAGWAPAAIGRDAAQLTATGAGVRVAVVDSGVAADHPHLAGAVEPGLDVVGQDPADTTGTADAFGHGSAVAAIIAGRAVVGSALVGVAPEATIVPVRVYYSDETDVTDDPDPAAPAGTGPEPGRIAQGIREAAGLDVEVIVVAMSTLEDDPDLAAAVDEATAAGSLVVASMGNVEDAEVDPTRPRYPAAYPEVLAVGAFGPGPVPVPGYRGEHADIGGPGVDVLATGRSGGDCVLGTATAATSWATAHVGGVAALVAQAHPQEAPAEWAHRITATAAPLTTARRSDLVGLGLVQAADAIAFVDDVTARPGTVTSAPDDVAAARGRLAWWALGAVVVVGGGLIVARRARRGAD